MTKQENLYLEAKKTYYEGNPIMTDAEFDRLEDELRLIGSSLIDIVGDKFDRYAKYPHITPMLSLAKYQTDKITGKPPTEKAIEWMKDKVNRGSQEHFAFEPKFDGNSVNAIYKNGKLWKMLSRGNGTLGRDYTSKLKSQVPNTIPILDEVEVRGEAVISKDIFAKKYSKFSNERNFVAGVLNDDKYNEATSEIVFVACEIRHTVSGITEHVPAEKLKEFGFNKNFELPHYYYHFSEFDKVFNVMKNYRETKCPFLLDGFVIKVAEKYRNIFGENSHDPNWAIAVKFMPKDVETTVIDIDWRMGKTGQYCPVAQLSPVNLDGTVVSQASIYNYGYVNKNQVYIGSTVQICKSGDIIPQIVKVIKPGDSSILKPQSQLPILPQYCEHCGSKLEIVNDIHLTCTNNHCEGIRFYIFQDCVSSLELFGVGPSVIKSIWDAGIHSAVDILNPEKFNKQTLLDSGQFVEGRSLEKLLDEVDKVNSLSLQQVIKLLGFKGMGETTSKQVANFIAGVEYTFSGLEKSIVEGFNVGQPKRTIIDNAIKEIEKWIVIEYPKSKKNIKYIELTGSPKSAGFSTKEEFLDTVYSFGFEHGKLNEASYLITDDISSTTSKMSTARKKGIAIYSYKEFIEQFTDLKLQDQDNNKSKLF